MNLVRCSREFRSAANVTGVSTTPIAMKTFNANIVIILKCRIINVRYAVCFQFLSHTHKHTKKKNTAQYSIHFFRLLWLTSKIKHSLISNIKYTKCMQNANISVENTEFIISFHVKCSHQIDR